MDLEQLDAIDTTDKEQVKTLQRWLQTRGLLPRGEGEIDGKWGGRTTEGFQEARQQFVDANKTRLGIAEAEREANDPVNKAINMGIEVAPYASGIVAGTTLGHYGFGKPFERRDQRQKDSAASLAKRTDIDATEKQAQLSRMNRRRAIGNAGQFAAPALLGGAGYATQNYFAPMFPEELQGTVRMVGTGENAAAMTLGLHQMVDSLRRGNPIADEDEAKIRSDASRARGGTAAQAQVNRLLKVQSAPPAVQSSSSRALPMPQKKPPQPPQQHSARLANAVSAVGGKPSKSKGANYQAFRKSLTDANAPEAAKALNLPEDTPRRVIMQRARELLNTRGISSWMLPFAAGALAYSMAPDEAQASTGGQETQPAPRENAYSGSPDDDFAYGQGTPSGGINEDALIAAGVAGGVTYGMNRLIPRGTMPLVGGMMGPIAAMTGPDFTPETEKFAANAAVRDMPWLRHVLPGRQEAYDMAQVPERNPARVYENAYAPGGQPSGYGQPDSFDADIAELQRLLSAMEAEGGQPMPQPQFRVPPPATGPQNRLLAVR